MVERSILNLGGLDGDAQPLLDEILSDEVGQRLRAERRLELVLEGRRLSHEHSLVPHPVTLPTASRSSGELP